MNALHVTQQIITDIEAGRFQDFQERGLGAITYYLINLYKNFRKLKTFGPGPAGVRTGDAPIYLSMYVQDVRCWDAHLPLGPISFIFSFRQNFCQITGWRHYLWGPPSPSSLGISEPATSAYKVPLNTLYLRKAWTFNRSESIRYSQCTNKTASLHIAYL